jgi:hypothetical protein
MKPLVMVEWAVYDYIPCRRRVVIVTLGEALQWVKEGAELNMYPIDPELFKEFEYVGQPPSQRAG